MGRANWVKGDTDGFDLWVVTWYKFRPIALHLSFQILFYFRQILLPVFDSRREDRPIHPLHEVVSIHHGQRDEVEPGGRSVSVFRTQRINTSPYEFLALFSCERWVLGGLRSIQRYEGCSGLAEVKVESTDLL
jgi:hypothetical protein